MVSHTKLPKHVGAIAKVELCGPASVTVVGLPVSDKNCTVVSPCTAETDGLRKRKAGAWTNSTVPADPAM